MGRSGGVFEQRGMVKMNVETRLQFSISPKLAETLSSDHNAFKKFDGVVSFKHCSVSNVGAFPARALAKASWIACLG